MATIQTYISNIRMLISRMHVHVSLFLLAVLFLLLSADCSGAAHSDTEKMLRFSVFPFMTRYDSTKNIDDQVYYPPKLVAQLAHIGRVAKKYDFDLSTLSSWQLTDAAVQFTSGHWLNVLHKLLLEAPDTSKIAADKDRPRVVQLQFVELIKAAERTIHCVSPVLSGSYLIAECDADYCPFNRCENPALGEHLLKFVMPAKSEIGVAFFGSGRLMQELLILDHLRKNNVLVSHIVLIDLVYAPMQGKIDQEKDLLIERHKAFSENSRSPQGFSRLLAFEGVYTLLQQFKVCLEDLYAERKPPLYVYCRPSDYENYCRFAPDKKVDMVIGVDLLDVESCHSGGDFQAICNDCLAEGGQVDFINEKRIVCKFI